MILIEILCFYTGLMCPATAPPSQEIIRACREDASCVWATGKLIAPNSWERPVRDMCIRIDPVSGHIVERWQLSSTPDGRFSCGR